MDYKGRLQQYFKTPIDYNTIQIGNEHKPLFKCQVKIDGKIFEGEVCKSKKESHNSVAKKMCEDMKIIYTDNDYKYFAEEVYNIIQTDNKSPELRNKLAKVLNTNRKYSNKEISRIINTLVEMSYLVKITFGRDSFYFHPSTMITAMEIINKENNP